MFAFTGTRLGERPRYRSEKTVPPFTSDLMRSDRGLVAAAPVRESGLEVEGEPVAGRCGDARRRTQVSDTRLSAGQ